MAKKTVSQSNVKGRMLAAGTLSLAVFAVAWTAYSAYSGESKREVAEGKSSSSSVKRTATTKTAKPKNKSYVIKSGDILSVISEKTGVSVDQILELNPDVDPQTLIAGQRLKLAR